MMPALHNTKQCELKNRLGEILPRTVITLIHHLPFLLSFLILEESPKVRRRILTSTSFFSLSVLFNVLVKVDVINSPDLL